MAPSKTFELQQLLISKLKTMRNNYDYSSRNYYQARERMGYVIWESLVIVKSMPPEDDEDIQAYASRLSSHIYAIGNVSEKYRQQTISTTRSILTALYDIYFQVSGKKWPYVLP